MKDYFSKIADGEIFEVNLTAPVDRNHHPVHFRSVTVKGKQLVQVTEREGQKSMHRNIPLSVAVDTIEKLLHSYKRLQIIFPYETIEWLANRKGEWQRQRVKGTGKPILLTHNRKKQHPLPEGIPIPFLVHLGVMKPDGSVYPAKYDKFRQINRFLELVDDVLRKLPNDKTMTIIDFGCGKAYLTFALYYWIRECCKRPVNILGLDLKDDVVKFCQETARHLKFEHLKFEVGRIEEMELNTSIDMVVTLHACNTATDAALAKALQWKAKAILSVPCCQHELFKQINCPTLKPLLKHGLLKERFSALVTDAARAELLELSGYQVDIVEFVDPEHTPKNLMIRAVRGKKGATSAEYRQFVDFLSVHPTLESAVKKMTSHF